MLLYADAGAPRVLRISSGNAVDSAASLGSSAAVERAPAQPVVAPMRVPATAPQGAATCSNFQDLGVILKLSGTSNWDLNGWYPAPFQTTRSLDNAIHLGIDTLWREAGVAPIMGHDFGSGSLPVSLYGPIANPTTRHLDFCSLMNSKTNRQGGSDPPCLLKLAIKLR
jgi:hypothetical protein